MGKNDKEMEVVKGIDLKRYMGRWYEIASFPSTFFEPKKGVNTRATYTLKEDGATVKVLNETWYNGKRVYIEGAAYKADPSDEAKLKVKFHVPPFLPIMPIIGDYWVLYLDDEYQYAVIGHPSRKYLLILSRKNEIDEEVYKELVEKATEQGYDVSKLHRTPQTNPPPEGDEAPTDKTGIWWIKSIFGK